MGTPLAELLCRVKFVTWDEAPMQNNNKVLAVDKTLRDIGKENKLFLGRISVIFGGNFAKILPVVKRRKRLDIVKACIRGTDFWDSLSILYLIENMRLATDEANIRWANWINN